ncbi:hypothetical protein [Streptomyces tendae]|uniref:hypothetical protein n=1 Tax=Streptomyces tendae TaxID=1932 RepID=UPI0033C01233
MPKPTDEERAAAVRTFYGLDGSKPILAPGYRPNRRAPQGATEFETRMRLRLGDLARDNPPTTAGPKEAIALEAARLPLKRNDNGKWSIDKAKARSEAEVIADAIDQQRADDVRTFYGLDGSVPILAPGIRPSKHAPEDASEFEKSMRLRLDDLARHNNHTTAGSEEAIALEAAGLPLKQNDNGKWSIDKAKARSEVEVKADAVDQQRADDVRAFYGLDGSIPIVAPGYRPSSHAPEDASEFEIRMRKRLAHLTADSPQTTAGPKEAIALEAAHLPLKQNDNGKWSIDKAKARSEVEVKADAVDQQRAESVRAFYGLDGSIPIVAPGYRPNSHAPEGASEFEKRMRKRLDHLTRDSSGITAGPEEAAALKAANLLLKEHDNGKWNIDNATPNQQQAPQNPVSVHGYDPAQGAISQVAALSQGMEQMSVTVPADAPLPADWPAWNTLAAQEPAYGVSDFSDGGGYPTNPVTAGPYLASNYGYSHAGQSSYTGSSPYFERPPSRADRPSKRGRK